MFKYDGVSSCVGSSCGGWGEIDHNPRTVEIVASGSAIFQRHIDGRIFKYDGQSYCTAGGCPGWAEIDRNARTVSLAATEPF